jgi:hypothetical protein
MTCATLALLRALTIKETLTAKKVAQPIHAKKAARIDSFVTKSSLAPIRVALPETIFFRGRANFGTEPRIFL